MGVKKCTQNIVKSINFQNPMLHSPFLYSRTLFSDRETCNKDNTCANIPHIISEKSSNQINVKVLSSKDFSNLQGKNIAVYYAGVTDSKGEKILTLQNSLFYSNILSSCK